MKGKIELLFYGNTAKKTHTLEVEPKKVWFQDTIATLN
jgi:hypothetical protein